jgi:hypothetical protein
MQTIETVLAVVREVEWNWKGRNHNGKSRDQKVRTHTCLCDVPGGKEYCGDSCRYAGSDDVEIVCQCDHTACPLTIRQFAPRFVADLAN